MYESPKLVRYGNFRELTLAGWQGSDDHMYLQNVTGCNLGDSCPAPSGGSR